VEFCDIEPAELEGCLYDYKDRDAILHLFKVACGLDSMILGENQVLGQLKDAYAAACDAHCNGRMLNRLAHAAFREGKAVRTKTGLNEGSLSVSYTACDLAARDSGDLSERKLFVIGAGETGELTARSMRKRGVSKIVVANRTDGRSAELALSLGCESIALDKLTLGLSEADIVVSCTSSKGRIVTERMVSDALKIRSSDAPLILIDLAMPRDIEQNCGQLENVLLYNIDDLQSMVSESAEKRQAEYEKALGIVHEAVDKFEEWQNTLPAVPTIRDLQTRFEQIRQDELQRMSSRLSAEEMSIADELTAAIVKRISNLAISNMKAVSFEPGAQEFLDSVRRLFDLREGDES